MNEIKKSAIELDVDLKRWGFPKNWEELLLCQ